MCPILPTINQNVAKPIKTLFLKNLAIYLIRDIETGHTLYQYYYRKSIKPQPIYANRRLHV